uniref:DNA polymerase delta subunit 2 n=1 Tax=Plectus sambesii TaxID=2011161 RepID=A0A914VBG5_9BILA
MKLMDEEMSSGHLERTTLPYKNSSDRFVLTNHAAENEPTCYRRQFASLYNVRLSAFTGSLTAAAEKKFKGKVPFSTLTDLKKEEKCYIIGVIVKQQKLRPSVLLELADEAGAQPQPVAGTRIALETDYLELEDDNQIVRLGGKINTDDFVTGVVVAVMGKELDNDTFEVEEIVYPPMATPAPSSPIQLQGDAFVLFVSGLSFTGKDGEDGNVLLSLLMMQRWLCGELATDREELEMISKISRIIVAGESIARSSEDREFSEKARYLTRKETSPSVECVRNVDQFLMHFAPLITIDLMPGLGDPTNHMLPQQPMHKCMFPKASKCAHMLNLVTNPYQAEIGGRTLLGTSGQNLSDMLRLCSERRTALDILESNLIWQHLCPNAPDTTDIFPFKFSDPFMITGTPPDIYFAGNQKQLEHRIMERPDGGKTLLLSVPSFKNTSTAAIVNLRTLEVFAQDFVVGEVE